MKRLIEHLCACQSTVVVSAKSICVIVWMTSWTSHPSFLLGGMTEASWGCGADGDQTLEGLVVTLISLDDLTPACLFPLFILSSCSHKYSPSLSLTLSKAHLPLPAPSFLWSFLLPGDAGDSFEGCCESRIRMEEEDGPNSRPFPSGNLGVPALFEACCDSPPCRHPSGPQTAHSPQSWVRCCSLPNADQPRYTQGSWEKPVK